MCVYLCVYVRFVQCQVVSKEFVAWEEIPGGCGEMGPVLTPHCHRLKYFYAGQCCHPFFAVLIMVGGGHQVLSLNHSCDLISEVKVLVHICSCKALPCDTADVC